MLHKTFDAARKNNRRRPISNSQGLTEHRFTKISGRLSKFVHVMSYYARLNIQMLTIVILVNARLL